MSRDRRFWRYDGRGCQNGDPLRKNAQRSTDPQLFALSHSAVYQQVELSGFEIL